jgi:hypothetical protein
MDPHPVFSPEIIQGMPGGGDWGVAYVHIKGFGLRSISRGRLAGLICLIDISVA